MLSRTADHLYWMARYIERAENLARMLDAHYRLFLLPRSAAAVEQGWAATLTSLGVREQFDARHAKVTPRAAIEFVAFDREHPGSIVSSLRAARENARAVRGTLTTEMYETLNATWLESRSFAPRMADNGIGEFIEWVKYRTHLTRGVTNGTMLRDEAWHFNAIGTAIERADNTTRMLEARWRDASMVNGRLEIEGSEWAVLLRALSAFGVYRRVYRANVSAECVTELLLLNSQMPRSVHRALDDLYSHLCAVRNSRSAETERHAGELHARLRFGTLDDLHGGSVPNFLDHFQGKLNELADGIGRDFLVAGYG